MARTGLEAIAVHGAVLSRGQYLIIVIYSAATYLREITAVALARAISSAHAQTRASGRWIAVDRAVLSARI